MFVGFVGLGGMGSAMASRLVDIMPPAVIEPLGVPKTVHLSIGVCIGRDRWILSFAHLGEGIGVEKCLIHCRLTAKTGARGAAWRLQRFGPSTRHDRSSSLARGRDWLRAVF